LEIQAVNPIPENCTSDIAYIKPEEKRVFNSNDKIVEITFLCYLTMYGSDAD
jgi:hypothetical protein